MKKSDRLIKKYWKRLNNKLQKMWLKSGVSMRVCKNTIAIVNGLDKLSDELLESKLIIINWYATVKKENSLYLHIMPINLKDDEDLIGSFEFEIFDDFIKKDGVCIDMFSEKPKRITEKMVDYIVYQVKYSVGN